MIKKFKFKESEEIVELECSEVKQNKNLEFVGCFCIYKTERGYVFSYEVNEVNFVFNQAKLLKDLSLSVPDEDELYMKCLVEKQDCCDVVWDVPECYRFEIGDELECGTVIYRSNDYNHYRIREEIIDKETGIKSLSYSTREWHSCFRKSKNESMNISELPVYFYNTSLSSIFCKLFHFGLDLNPSYQRGRVWTEEQKINLIDSLFHHSPCFQVVIAEKKWINGEEVVDGEMEEVVDGKQRISTVLDFISGKFKYNGLYFHEMSRYDRNKFMEAPISIGEIRFGGRSYDEETVLKVFIALNTGGTFMSSDVIEKAKSRLSEIEK